MYIVIFEQKNKCNMADFQGKYNGDQIEQLLDKANDIDLTKYALKTDNAPTATKLQAARTIALSGAVTGSVSSDFGSNVTISTTLANFDASKIASGTISIDRLPKAALERLVVVADDTARFALTTATAQSGDTVKVTSTGKMYLIKDESKLNSEDGYEPYTAGQVASVTITQAEGDSYIELDKEVINLDVNGTAQTVNVTSNDTWSWAQVAARTAMKMMKSMGL